MTTLNWQGDQLLKSEYCLFQKGPSNLYGCGNYAVNITEKGEPIYTLFLLDNGRYYEYEDGSKREIYMGYEQIAWYEWNVKGIEKAAGRLIPSMTFSHFALPEMRQAVEKTVFITNQTKAIPFLMRMDLVNALICQEFLRLIPDFLINASL